MVMQTIKRDGSLNYALLLLQRRMTILDRQAQELRGDPSFEAQLPVIEDAILDCQRACLAIAAYERAQPRGLPPVNAAEEDTPAGDVETTPATPNAKKRGRPKKAPEGAPPPAAPPMMGEAGQASARTPALFPSPTAANGHAIASEP